MSPEIVDQWVNEIMGFCWDTDDGQIKKLISDRLTEAYNEGYQYAQTEALQP